MVDTRTESIRTRAQRPRARAFTATGMSLALLLTVAACAPVADGPPNPSPSQPTVEPDALVGIDPCELADEETLATYYLSEPEQAVVGEAQICRLRFDDGSLDTDYDVTIELFSTRGLDDIVATEITERLPTGTHPMFEWTRESDGGCVASLGVGDDARVDVAAAGADLDFACSLALAFAVDIEPAIP